MRLSTSRKVQWRPILVAASLVVPLIAGSGVLAPTSVASALPVAAPISSDPMKFVADMQPGFNVGNSLDAFPTETSWGNPPITQALLQKIKSLGFKSVRIPVTWGGHEGAAPSYAIDPSWMARVKQVVDWALSDGLYVVLNVHHDSWQWITNMPTDPTGVTARYDATWTQIADAFKNEPRSLVFEADNEQNFTGVSAAQASQLLNELQTDFFNVVRRSGSENAMRYLMLSTPGDTAAQPGEDALYAEMQSLHDPNLIASFHYYGFWPFGVNVAGYSRFDATSQQDMVNAFTLMHDEFVAKGIPVYLGEAGLYNDTDWFNGLERGETLKYYEALGYEARTTGVTLSYWDDGSRLLNRNSLQVLDPATFAVMQSSWTTRSGTGANDTVYVPKASAISDQTLALNPNGLQFTGLSDGERRLRKGSDYTYSAAQCDVPMERRDALQSYRGKRPRNMERAGVHGMDRCCVYDANAFREQ